MIQPPLSMYRNGIKNLYNNKNNNFIENIIFPSSKTFSIFLLLLIINNNISSTGTVIAEATTINIQSDTNKAYRPEVSRGFTPKEKIAYESVVTCIRVKYKGDAQETFEKYDNNNNGVANIGEIIHFLKDCKLDSYYTRKRWVERIINKLDQNKDGDLTIYELHQITLKTSPLTFKLTEACYDKECVARTGPRNKRI